MKIARFHSFSDFSDYRGTWEALAADSPMMSPQWIIPWWRAYQSSFGNGSADGELCLLGGMMDDHLVGIAPFYVDRSKGRTKKLRLLGDGKVCSDHITLLSQPGFGDRFVDGVADWLEGQVGETWDAAHWECIDTDDSDMTRLVNQLGEKNLSIYRRDAVSSWQIELPQTWEGYLKSLSKNHRKRCRKWYREWIESGKLQVVTVTQVDQLDEAFEMLCRLHNARRRSLGSPGAFEDQTFYGFHQQAARELMATNKLRISFLMTSDGKPIAGEYQLLSHDTVFSYQSGVDPEFLDIGVGNISVLMLIRTTFDDGYRTFDFLRGSESYKKSWSAEETKTFDVHINQKTLNGSLAYAKLGTKDWLRSVRSAVTSS